MGEGFFQCIVLRCLSYDLLSVAYVVCLRPRFFRRTDLEQQQLSEPNLRSGSIFVSRPCKKRNVWKLLKLGLISGYSKPIRKRVIEWCFDKRASRKILARSQNLRSVLDGSRSLVFGWLLHLEMSKEFWQRFSESRNCRFFLSFLWSSGVKFFRVYGYSQERIKGTEKASSIHTLLHRYFVSSYF